MTHDIARYQAEFASMVGKRRVDLWNDMSPKSGENIFQFARRLLGGFYREMEGSIVPIVAPSEFSPIPDVVTIRAYNGQFIFRWSYVDEMSYRDMVQ